MDRYYTLMLMIFTIVHISVAAAATDLSVCDIHRTGDDLSVSVLNNGSNTTARLTVYAVAENNALVESLHPYPAEGVHHCNETWNVTHPGAVRMRIHFSEIEVYGGAGERDRLIIEDGDGGLVCAYPPMQIRLGPYMPYRASDVHTPWVAGDTVRVVLNITHNRTQFKTYGFQIDEYDTYESSVPIYDEDIDFGDHELKEILFPTGRDYIVAIIDEADSINETNETNNELTRKLSPEITEIEFDPAVPMIGDTVAISAGVRNPGTDTTTGVLLRIDDADVANTTLSIAHNETGTAVFHWTATVGCHNITIVTDDDELDDVLCVYHSDLSVTDLTIEPEDPPVIGDPVTLATDGVGDILVYDWGTVPYHLAYETSMPSSTSHCWTIRHPGADWIQLHLSHLELYGDYTHLDIVDANGTLIESYAYNDAYINNFTDIRTDKVGGDTMHICLKIGETYSPFDPPINSANLTIDKYEYRVNTPISLNWSAYPAGHHNITAVVNENKSILELNYTNNAMSRELLVSGPDLSIAHVNLTPDGSITDGEVVEICATVKNIGVMPATSDIGFFVDNERIDAGEVTLAEGGSTTITAAWTAQANIHEIRVVADAEDDVSETIETNNELVRVVEVAGADFSVPVVTVDPKTISATIRNTGSESDVIIEIYDCIFRETYDSLITEIDAQPKTVRVAGADCISVNFSCIDSPIPVSGSSGSGTVTISEPGWVVMPGDTISLHVQDTPDNRVHADFYAGPVIASFDETIGRNESRDLSTGWAPVAGSHAAVVIADPGQVVCETCEVNNFGVACVYIEPTTDFAVTGMHIDPPDVVDGDSADITVLLNGTADGTLLFTMEDHTTRNLTEGWYGESLAIAHNSDAIRVHFNELHTPATTYLNITDADGTVRFSHTYYDRPLTGNWSPWIYAETIKIVKVDNPAIEVEAAIDKYECKDILKNETIMVVANVTEEITAEWQASTGNHTIHAEIVSGVMEINGENNRANTTISVRPSNDPAVLNVTYDPPDPENGDIMLINASIANIGFRQSDCVVEIWDSTERNLTIEADDFFKWYTRTWRIPRSGTKTGTDADMTGVHFESIDTDVPGDHSLYVYDATGAEIADFSYCKREDLWVWGGGEFLTVSFRYKHGGVPRGFRIDRYAHKRLLNRTTVSLGSGETTMVNAAMNATTGWHTIKTILDPEGRIDEINESNNLLRKSVWVKGPDLTPVSIRSEGGKISAVIRNVGDARAGNVTVSFCREVNHSCSHKRFNDPVTEIIDHTDATRIRVRFKDMDMYGNMYIKDKDGGVVDEYSGKVSDIWTQWVHGDMVEINADVCDEFGVPLSSFEIDRYEYEFESESEIIDLDAHDQTRVVGDVTCEYEEPYNLSVWVDVDDDILESDEDNNNKNVMVYVDLVADGIVFVSPDRYMLSLDAEKFVLDGLITNGGAKDTVVVPVSDFNVTLEIKHGHSNGTVGDAVFNMTKYVEEPFDDGQHGIRFEFDPNDKFETGGNYTVSLTVDSTDDVCESSDSYPLGEDNNAISVAIYVHNSSGYTGGGDLINVAQGEVRGRVVYTVGDSQYGHKMNPGEVKTVKYTEAVPDCANSIKFARIFIYWFAYHWGSVDYVPDLADVDVTFNGHALKKAGNYSDNPGASMNNYGYGLYSYDVTDHVTIGETDVATVKNNADEHVYMGVHAIGLLVAYGDEKEVLTKYWVNEGADIMMAANNRYPTGLPSGDCVTTASFKGVERNDIENVNATLLTILGMHSAYSPDELSSNPGDAYEFNNYPIGSVDDTSHWINVDHIGYTINFNRNGGWDTVTDYLKCGNNLAGIHSKGNYMLVNNAFLRLIFPPDLVVTNLTAPDSTVVGAHHSINATIRNDGKSDAHDFNVTLYIGKKQMVRIPHLDLPAGNATTLHLYNWTPKMLGYVYNLTVAADVLSGEDWIEVETENNAMTRHVLIEEGGFGNQTGPRGIGGGAEATGGVFTEKVTGRVMQGMKEFLSFGGGGGAGMFSLTEWIMKSVVWSVLLLFVALGYWVEGRSYGRANRGLQQPY